MSWLKPHRVAQPALPDQAPDWLVLSYKLPGIHGCYTICHTGQNAAAVIPADFIGFVWQRARQLACAHGLAADSYVILQNGRDVARRDLLHFHVFLLKNRWQRAWLYQLLMLRQVFMGLQAIWRFN